MRVFCATRLGNGIVPGAIKTDINRDAWSTPLVERQLLSLIPYGRVSDPEDGGMPLYPGFYENG